MINHEGLMTKFFFSSNHAIAWLFAIRFINNSSRRNCCSEIETNSSHAFFFFFFFLDAMIVNRGAINMFYIVYRYNKGSFVRS